MFASSINSGAHKLIFIHNYLFIRSYYILDGFGSYFLFFSFFFFFWLCHVACGILVPQPGIEPMPPAVEEQSLNH